MLVHIEATKMASRRTKTRVRDMGPVFEIVRLRTFEGEEGIHVRHTSGWHGWLPFAEIKYTRLH